jgi:choline dehydrogenase
MGIDVVHNLAPVGGNLHDHFNTYVAWRSAVTGTFNELHRQPLKKLAAGLRYVLGRDGPLTAIGTIAGILTRTDPRFAEPDLQINTYLWSIETRDHTGMHPHKFPGFSMSPVHLRPEGRGRVSLKSRDPLAPPKIEFKFLESTSDIDAMIFGVRLARKIAEQPALKRFVAEEIVPGPKVQTEEQLIADIRNRGVSNLHPVGTCRMGIGADAVVDPRLRVHGVRGLRVADASIMPLVVGGNTNAPSIMIGEKCAAMVIEDAQTA